MWVCEIMIALDFIQPNLSYHLIILENQGYENFLWVDDNFTISKKRIMKLSNLIRKEKIDLKWMAEGRVTQSSKDLLTAMKLMGCKVISFGIESGSQRVLDWYNKQINLNQVHDAIKTSKKVDFDIVIGNFILGAPIETREEAEKIEKELTKKLRKKGHGVWSN